MARECCKKQCVDDAKGGARALRNAARGPCSISAIEKRLAVPEMGPLAVFAVCGGRRLLEGAGLYDLD